MKSRLHRMLNDPNKEITKVSGPLGMLSRLFRRMLSDLGIGPIQFGMLMQDYVQDSANLIPPNKKDQTVERGNLTKQLWRAQMTWRVFCKALKFLQLWKIDIVIKAYHIDGRETVHFDSMEFGGRAKFQDFMNKLEQPEENEEQGEPHPTLDHFEQLEKQNPAAAAEAHASQTAPAAEVARHYEDMLRQHKQQPIRLEPNNWYVWSPGTKLVYEHIGPLHFARFVGPRLEQMKEKKVFKWQGVAPDVRVEQGRNVHAQGFYSEGSRKITGPWDGKDESSTSESGPTLSSKQ